jgi:hypothetical protein
MCLLDFSKRIQIALTMQTSLAVYLKGGGLGHICYHQPNATFSFLNLDMKGEVTPL